MIKAGSIIKDLFKNNSRNAAAAQENIKYTQIWRHITGKNIERRTRPVALKNGVLFVDVEDSVWLYQLTLLKDKLIDDFNAHAGEALISDIMFRSMGFSLLSTQKIKTMDGLPQKKDSFRQKTNLIKENLGAADQITIEKIMSTVPEPLREKMFRLLSSFFRMQQWKKKQGAKICPCCRTRFLEIPQSGESHGQENICMICHQEIKA